MSEQITKTLVAESLAPLIQFAQANPGTLTRLAVRLKELTGENQYRQNIGEWLHPDPAKRIEPRFGMGLLLVQVWEAELSKESGNGAAAAGPSEVDGKPTPKAKAPRKSKPARKNKAPRKPRKPRPAKGKKAARPGNKKAKRMAKQRPKKARKAAMFGSKLKK